MINPGGYITWSDATYYKEYVFITDQAKLYRQQELATRSTEGDGYAQGRGVI